MLKLTVSDGTLSGGITDIILDRDLNKDLEAATGPEKNSTFPLNYTN